MGGGGLSPPPPLLYMPCQEIIVTFLTGVFSGQAEEPHPTVVISTRLHRNDGAKS